MPTQKIDPKVIFASDAPAIDKPPVFSDKTKGWDVARANDGRPEIKQMNKMQQDTDLKILWLNENAVLPYDETIDYPECTVTLKDGSFKQLVSGAWVEFLDDFADKDAVKRGIANRYDSSLTYNSGERVVLTNGDIVKSTIDGNTNDPNVDMTGWVNVSIITEVSPEMFGYVSGDATQAFKAAALYAKEHNTPLVAKNKNGYPLSESLDFYTPTDISEVILQADGVFRYLTVKSAKTPETIPFSSLSGLTEFSAKVTGFPLSAVGKYIRITSTDILTERNNAPSNTPYYKNTTFRLLDSLGGISPSLDMTFNTGSTAIVSIIPPESRIKLKIGKLTAAGAGANNNSIVIERDSVDFNLGDVSGSTGFRTLVTLSGNDCNFFSPVIKDAQYEGLGYGISIGNSCDTNIYGMKASNCRTTLDGRHGANVMIHNSRLETAGTHWGNNYSFKDCDIDTVTWAGKDLSVMGGSLRNLISMRADVAMCIGRVEISNGTKLYSTAAVILPSANIIAGFFTSPRRLFDEVVVDNVQGFGLTNIYGYTTLANHSADWIPPKYFNINNVFSPSSATLRPVFMNLANAVALTETAKVRVSNITAKVVVPFSARGFSKYTSAFGYDVRAVDCGKTYVQCDASTFSKYKIIDSELVSAVRINASTALGVLLLDDCVIKHDATVNATQFNLEAKKGFSGCEYQGAFSNGGSVNGVTLYSLNCCAVIGASGYPPLDWYVNETDYLKQDVLFAFDPPSIPANSPISTTVTVVGARVGDFVSATFSIYNAGINVSAAVSATNTVTVTFKNTTGVAIDLAAGNIKIKMI